MRQTVAVDREYRATVSYRMRTMAAMQDLNDLYFFVHVVEHGGFAPAGRALGMPQVAS